VLFRSLNFGLLAGIPLPRNSTIFGKLGVSWGHTEAAGSSQNGWGPSVGAGAMIGLTRSLAPRADWGRGGFKLPRGRSPRGVAPLTDRAGGARQVRSVEVCEAALRDTCRRARARWW